METSGVTGVRGSGVLKGKDSNTGCLYGSFTSRSEVSRYWILLIWFYRLLFVFPDGVTLFDLVLHVLTVTFPFLCVVCVLFS